MSKFIFIWHLLLNLLFVPIENSQSFLNCVEHIENPECDDEIVTCYDYWLRGTKNSGLYKLRLYDEKLGKAVYSIIWCDMKNGLSVVHNSLSFHGNSEQMKRNASSSINIKYQMNWNSLKNLIAFSDKCSQDLLISCNNTPMSFSVNNDDIVIRSLNSPNIQWNTIRSTNFVCNGSVQTITLDKENVGIYALGVKDLHGDFNIRTGPLTCFGKKGNGKICSFRFINPGARLEYQIEDKRKSLNISTYFRTQMANTNLFSAYDSSNELTLSVALLEGRIIELKGLSNEHLHFTSHKADNEWHFISIIHDGAGVMKIKVDFELFSIKSNSPTSFWSSVKINEDISIKIIDPTLKNFLGCIYNLTINSNSICTNTGKTKIYNVVEEDCMEKVDYARRDDSCYLFPGDMERNFIFITTPVRDTNSDVQYSFYFSTYQERALLLWAIHKENTGNHIPQTVQIELESSTKLVASICYNVSCYSCSVEKIQGFNDGKKHFVGFYTLENKPHFTTEEAACQMLTAIETSKVIKGNMDKTSFSGIFFGGLFGTLRSVDPTTFYHFDTTQFKSLSLKGAMSDIFIDRLSVPYEGVIDASIRETNVRRDCKECHCADNVPCHVYKNDEYCDCPKRFMSVDRRNSKRCLKTNKCFILKKLVEFYLNQTNEDLVNKNESGLIQLRELWIALKANLSEFGDLDKFSFAFQSAQAPEQMVIEVGKRTMEVSFESSPAERSYLDLSGDVLKGDEHVVSIRRLSPDKMMIQFDNVYETIDLSAKNLVASKFSLNSLNKIQLKSDHYIQLDFFIQFDKRQDGYNLPEFVNFEMDDFVNQTTNCSFPSIYLLDILSVSKSGSKLTPTVLDKAEVGSYPPKYLPVDEEQEENERSSISMVLIIIIVAIICLIILFSLITVILIFRKKRRNKYPVKREQESTSGNKRKNRRPDEDLESEESVPFRRSAPVESYRNIQENFDERIAPPAEADNKQTDSSGGDLKWSFPTKHAPSIDEDEEFREFQKDLAKTPSPTARAKIARGSEFFDDDI